MTDNVQNKIDKFFNQFRLRKYTAGQILILNGDQSIFVYYLISGKVKQYDVTYRGEEIILNIFKPPAFFPMSLAINRTPNPYIYEAETDIEIRQAPADEVVKFIKQEPDVLFDLLSRVYHGVDGLLGRMTYVMTSSARSRLIYELLIEARRFSKVEDDGSCIIALKEKDLAARAGLSRETVSREVRKLKTEGLIDSNIQSIRIPDIVTLEKLLAQDV